MRVKTNVVNSDICRVGRIRLEVSLVAADDHPAAVVTKFHRRPDLLVRRGAQKWGAVIFPVALRVWINACCKIICEIAVCVDEVVDADHAGVLAALVV
ncbi:MAG: hypothetical protein CMA64_08500 [Euryarchaeota archaeon]|nr:hypothetical protein [Euryarchaeota archaeon]